MNTVDPVPALGGATRDETRLRNAGMINLETVDDDLYAAMKAGDEVHVRARLGGSDKPLTEAEEIILVRTRQIEEEMAYGQMLEAMDAAADDDDEEPATGMFYMDTVHHVSHAAMLMGADVYGGRYDRKRARYFDKFGGAYDAHGYMSPDGSYRTAAGDHYDGSSHSIRLAVGGQQYLPEHLLGHGADVVRLAVRIAEIREAARAERLAAESSETTAAPRAVDTMPVHAAAKSEAAFVAACCAQDAAEKARFEKIATDADFQRAANETPGGGMDHMSCRCVTSKEVKMAADILAENIANGNIPALLTRYHYKNILDLADDAEDRLAVKLQKQKDDFEDAIAQLNSITNDANNAFAKGGNNAVMDLGYALKDKADAVFGRKSMMPVIENALAAVTGKPRNLFRRPGATMNA
jgi:hypothetical protein